MAIHRSFLSALSAVAVLLAALGSHKDHQVSAWGNTGHSLTGRLAMQLLSETTKAQLKQLLPNVDGDISLVSSWADKVKRLPRYSHTGPLHYSDAHDDPPYACSYIFKRDCPDGNCVIAGIRNFTSILQEHRKNLLEKNPDAFHTLTDDEVGDVDMASSKTESEYDDVGNPESKDASAFPITQDLHPNPAYLRHQVQKRDLRLFSDLYHSIGIRSRFAVVATRRNRHKHGGRLREQRRKRRRNRRRNRRNRNRRNRNPGGSLPQKPSPPPPGPPAGFVYTPQEAIKFLVHLVQDVHQPLHVSGREKGGNGADALFDGEHVNLHVVWDSKLLEKALNEDYGGNMMYLADVLLNKLRVEWEPEVETWMTCPAPERPGSPTANYVSAISSDASTTPPGFLTPLDMIMCPEHWARGVDQLNCNNVWLKYSPDKDLSKEYYKENIATVLKSVAMAGVRLAALLEAIFNPDRI